MTDHLFDESANIRLISMRSLAAMYLILTKEQQTMATRLMASLKNDNSQNEISASSPQCDEDESVVVGAEVANILEKIAQK